MGYDIDLMGANGVTLEVSEPHQLQGSTYAVGGTTELSMTATFNYSGWFRRGFTPHITEGERQGLRSLQGTSVRDSLPEILQAIERIRQDPDAQKWSYEAWAAQQPKDFMGQPLATPTEGNYWVPSPANAIKALQQLVSLALLAPNYGEAYWDIR